MSLTTEPDNLLVETLADLLRHECAPAVVAEAERQGWAPALWGVLEQSGFSRVGVEATLPEALAVVRTAARFAAPVPLAETVLATLLEPQAPPGPLSVAIAGRAAYGRVARAIVGAPEARLKPAVNYAGEPFDEVEPAGFDRLLPLGALVRAAQMAGALETVLELTVSYAGTRQQFDQPLDRFQAVQQQLALLAGEVSAARAAVDLAAAEPSEINCAAAKIRCGESATAATAIAHQVHGAIGVTHEHRLQQYTRRLWSWRDECGTEAEWAIWLGSRLAESGADAWWEASA